MIYSHAKVRGQQSVGSEDYRVENKQTDGKTDGGDCITCRINSVGKNRSKWRHNFSACVCEIDSSETDGDDRFRMGSAYSGVIYGMSYCIPAAKGWINTTET